MAFTPDRIVVVPRRRAWRLTCPCGWSTAAVDDQSTRRWRRLELGAVELVLQAEMRRPNSRIRLINHGGYGRHSAAAVIAMIPLCCSGLTVTLPRGGLARQLALLHPDPEGHQRGGLRNGVKPPMSRISDDDSSRRAARAPALRASGMMIGHP